MSEFLSVSHGNRGDAELLRHLCCQLAEHATHPVAREMAREILAGRVSLRASPASLAYRDLFHELLITLQQHIDGIVEEEEPEVDHEGHRQADALLDWLCGGL